MKIKYVLQPTPKTVDSFAVEHDLTMKVVERERQNLPRFYAEFENAEVKIGVCLHGYYGNGQSPEEAISDYIDRIEGHTLVVNAAGKDRKEIYVPTNLKKVWYE